VAGGGAVRERVALKLQLKPAGDIQTVKLNIKRVINQTMIYFFPLVSRKQLLITSRKKKDFCGQCKGVEVDDCFVIDNCFTYMRYFGIL